MELKGMFKSVIFYNESNSYLVARFVPETTYNAKEKRNVIITGNLPILSPEESYSLTGEFKAHPKYGRQFHVQSFSKITPASIEGTIKYLSSSLFPGIGKNSAEKLVTHFGKDILTILAKNPERIFEVKSIKAPKLEVVKQVLIENQEINELHKFFIDNNISMRYYVRLTNFYGEENLLATIKEKNYHIIDEVDGMSFKVANNIIRKLAPDLNPELEVLAALNYVINQLAFSSGDTLLNPERIFDHVKDWVQRYVNDVESNSNLELAFINLIKKLITNQKVFFMQGRLSSDRYFNAAHQVIDILKRLKMKSSVIDFTKLLPNTNYQVILDQIQIDAVMMALNNSITIITGGPGTGKTSIIKSIINNLVTKYHKDDILLLAPTGKAAKILRDKTHYYASTIHKALMWDAHTNRFEFNSLNPLEQKVLIIDEFSMVDTWLFEQLLIALPSLEKLIIVGDEQQLESVLPGSVLRDLLSSKMFNITKLQKIYRQGQGSGVLKLSNLILGDQALSEVDLIKNKCFFKELSNQEALVQLTDKYCQLVAKYDIDSVQILAPVYNGVCGIDAINRQVQNAINPLKENQKQVMIGLHHYRIGDKVMHLKNRKDNGLFNGDFGYIVAFDISNKVVSLTFGDISVNYKYNDFMIHVTLAYAISIHKAQGSESKCILMPLLTDYYKMLNKKIIYTAITRSSQELYLFGHLKALNIAIKNHHYHHRQTILSQLITK